MSRQGLAQGITLIPRKVCSLSGAVLDDRMQYVKVGQEVRITYKGQTKNQRNQAVNLYEIAVAEQNSDKEEDVDVAIEDIE